MPFAYPLVAQLAPGAFFLNNGTTTGHSLHGADAFYFSLITLSTVGYGDIIPVSNVARMLELWKRLPAHSSWRCSSRGWWCSIHPRGCCRVSRSIDAGNSR